MNPNEEYYEPESCDVEHDEIVYIINNGSIVALEVPDDKEGETDNATNN